MNNKWVVPNDVAQYFKTIADGSHVDELIDELDTMIVSSHPDKYGGEFPSSHAKERFHELQDAILFLKERRDGFTTKLALVPIEEIRAIVKATVAELGSKPNEVQANFAQYQNDLVQQVKRRFTAPRITSGVFLTVSSALFAFSGGILNHPLWGAYAQLTVVKSALLLSWLTSGGLFVATWWQERLVESYVSYLMSDACIETTFDDVCRKTSWANGRVNNRFSQSAYLDSLLAAIQYRSPRNRFFVQRAVSQAVAAGIVQKHIDILLSRNAIMKLTTPSVAPTFQIASELIEPYVLRYQQYQESKKDQEQQV